jgi:hypothetical protein
MGSSGRLRGAVRIGAATEFWLLVEFVAAVGSRFEKGSRGRRGRIPPLGACCGLC